MTVKANDLSAMIDAAVKKALLETEAAEGAMRLETQKNIPGSKPNPAVPPARFPWPWPIGLILKGQAGAPESIQATEQ